MQVCDFTSLGHLEELCLELRARPPNLLELSLDGAADVETPYGPSGWKAQALEGNGELGAPTLVRLPGSHDPDGIPIVICLAVSEHQAIRQDARWIGGEVEGIALVAESVEEDAQPVVGIEAGIAGHLRSQHLFVSAVAHNADVEVALS
jgi:hypothetical protein